MGPPHLRLLVVFDEQLIMGASWQLTRLRMTVGLLSFPLHGLMTSRYRGESAVCLPSGRRGISPLIRSSVIKLLCHASPVFPQFRVNGSHLFQPWANPGIRGEIDHRHSWQSPWRSCAFRFFHRSSGSSSHV